MRSFWVDIDGCEKLRSGPIEHVIIVQAWNPFFVVGVSGPGATLRPAGLSSASGSSGFSSCSLVRTSHGQSDLCSLARLLAPQPRMPQLLLAYSLRERSCFLHSSRANAIQPVTKSPYRRRASLGFKSEFLRRVPKKCLQAAHRSTRNPKRCNSMQLKYR